MKRISIVIDIQCKKQGAKTIYRIYVDNDLITERDWVWPKNKLYVRENLIVELDQGPHSIKVESVTKDSAFEVRGCIVDGKSVTTYKNFIV